jgi:hypothetical protein
MKRFLVSILAVLYMVTASGATVHLHYCMGKFVDASFVGDNDEEHECSSCGMTKKQKKGCCKDEHKVIKTDPSQQTVKASFHVTDLLYIPQDQCFYSPYQATHDIRNNETLVACHAPPSHWRSCPIYIQVRNFRI